MITVVLNLLRWSITSHSVTMIFMDLDYENPVDR
jgi:hypothetical protein